MLPISTSLETSGAERTAKTDYESIIRRIADMFDWRAALLAIRGWRSPLDVPMANTNPARIFRWNT
jgi:hypothetical protein